MEKEGAWPVEGECGALTGLGDYSWVGFSQGFALGWYAAPLWGLGAGAWEQ